MNAYAADDFSAEAEQYRYEHGQHVLNPRKVVRKFDKDCAMWHGIYGDRHDRTENGVCVCCGAVEADYASEELPPATVAKFERIMELELVTRGDMVSVQFAPNMLPDRAYADRVRHLEESRKELSEALDTLTPEEGKAFGRYRLQWYEESNRR